MNDNERILNAKIHIALGGDCARCERVAKKEIDGLAYCSDECEERISDYGLDDATQSQHNYTQSDASSDLAEFLRTIGYQITLVGREKGWLANAHKFADLETLKIAEADSLPLAICKITEMIIENE